MHKTEPTENSYRATSHLSYDKMHINLIWALYMVCKLTLFMLVLFGACYLSKAKCAGRRRPAEKGRMVDVEHIEKGSIVDVDGCLFLDQQQAALFITP